MKKIFLVVLSLLMLVGMIVFSGCQKEEDQVEMENTFISISMDEAAARLSEETDYILLDVRREDEYLEGHIEGAINFANEDITDEKIPCLPDFNQRIYVYCRSGNRSKQAADKLVKIGYTNVIEIGGIIDWKGDIVEGEE